MTQSSAEPALNAAFEEWLKAEILKLSVDTLKSEAVTCTACGEIQGTYIIDYKGNRFRFPADRTYAFLQFVLAGQA